MRFKEFCTSKPKDICRLAHDLMHSYQNPQLMNPDDSWLGLKRLEKRFSRALHSITPPIKIGEEEKKKKGEEGTMEEEEGEIDAIRPFCHF